MTLKIKGVSKFFFFSTLKKISSRFQKNTVYKNQLFLIKQISTQSSHNKTCWSDCSCRVLLPRDRPTCMVTSSLGWCRVAGTIRVAGWCVARGNPGPSAFPGNSASPVAGDNLVVLLGKLQITEKYIKSWACKYFIEV